MKKKKKERENEHRDQELNTEGNQLQEVLALGRRGRGVNKETEKNNFFFLGEEKNQTIMLTWKLS